MRGIHVKAALLFVLLSFFCLTAQRVLSHEKMLVKPRARICYVCHGDKEKVYAESGHGKFDVTCAMCHNPHGEGNEKMLKKPAKELCLLCHSDLKAHYMSTGHGKVELTCTMCHNPHGTPAAEEQKPKSK
ncbi:MAG: cytochrome c3 family protein [bacterium]